MAGVRHHPYDLLAAAHRRVLRAWLKPRFASFGAGASFDPVTSTITGYECIHVGDGVFIGSHAHLSADGVEIVLGADTAIGPGFYAIAGDHRFDQPGVAFQASDRGVNKPIRIGCNVWIGARVTVLKGVTIGDGAVVGAGSVVTRDVEVCAVVVGAPARVVRQRFEGQDREVHERLLARLRDRPA
ncbi:MAG: acyltransferase [Chloroflexi bacterium]|nr:acyltransferase [Chloroflexota bacterium]